MNRLYKTFRQRSGESVGVKTSKGESTISKNKDHRERLFMAYPQPITYFIIGLRVTFTTKKINSDYPVTDPHPKDLINKAKGNQ